MLVLQGLCVCDLLSGGAGHSLQNDVGILSTPQEGPQGCHLKSHLEVSPTQPNAACFRSQHLQSIDLVKIQTHEEFFYLFIEQYIYKMTIWRPISGLRSLHNQR